MAIEGQVIARKYRLERFLGSGGFASVWAARHLALDRLVALKILADTHSRNEKVVARFLREARLASRPLHPVIVRVEDLGQTDEGAPFLVMEMLEGRTLDDELQEQGPLALDEALAIMTPLLEGLATAHDQGIIHRDIKPANIFLVSPGSAGPAVRILDLGLAKLLSGEEGLTQTGAFMGTPDFVPPEIFLRSERDRWTAQADVFSCGVLLFNMLTGEFPFPAEPEDEAGGALKIAARALFFNSITELPGPAERRPEIPAALDAVVRRALALDPAKRHASARAMLADLERYGDHLPASTRSSAAAVTAAAPTDPPFSLAPSSRPRSPVLWAVLGAVGAFLVAGVLFLGLGGPWSPSEPPAEHTLLPPAATPAVDAAPEPPAAVEASIPGRPLSTAPDADAAGGPDAGAGAAQPDSSAHAKTRPRHKAGATPGPAAPGPSDAAGDAGQRHAPTKGRYVD